MDLDKLIYDEIQDKANKNLGDMILERSALQNRIRFVDSETKEKLNHFRMDLRDYFQDRYSDQLNVVKRYSDDGDEYIRDRDELKIDLIALNISYAIKAKSHSYLRDVL